MNSVTLKFSLFFYLLLISINIYSQVDSCAHLVKKEKWNLEFCLKEDFFLSDMTGELIVFGKKTDSESQISFYNKYPSQNFCVWSDNQFSKIILDTLYHLDDKIVCLKIYDYADSRKLYSEFRFNGFENVFSFNKEVTEKYSLSQEIKNINDILKNIKYLATSDMSSSDFQGKLMSIIKDILEGKCNVNSYLLNEFHIRSFDNSISKEYFKNEKKFMVYINQKNEEIITELKKIPTSNNMKISGEFYNDKTVKEGFAYSGRILVNTINSVFKIKLGFILVDKDIYIAYFKITS